MDQQTIALVKDIAIVALVVYIIVREIVHGATIRQLTDTIAGFTDNPTVIASTKALAESVPQPVFVAMISALTGARALIPDGDVKYLADKLDIFARRIDHDTTNDPVTGGGDSNAGGPPPMPPGMAAFIPIKDSAAL